MPPIATLLTAVAMVPLLVFAGGAVNPLPQTAERMLVALIDYAALLLAFAGGVHWGLGMWPESARPGARFVAGILPMIVAWVALILAQMVSPSVAMMLLIMGYLATVLTEHRAAQRFLIPSRYMWLRWGVSGVTMAMMALVLLLRGIGQTIVF